MNMAESKQCVVFGVQRKTAWGVEALDWYGFDSLFSPVKEEEKEEKLVYDDPDVCEDCDDYLEKWAEDTYSIVEAKLDDGSSIAKPLFTQQGYHHWSSYACWKNRLYRIGGQYHSAEERMKLGWKIYKCLHRYTNRVESWNPLRSDTKGKVIKWKLRSQMHHLRSDPHVLVMGPCMYVAGGHYIKSEKEKNKLVFMEMLESNKRGGGWVIIANPPEESNLLNKSASFVSAAWEGAGKLLFGSTMSPYFYTYTPASSSWKQCDHLPFNWFLFNCTEFPGIVVGDHCLWLNKGLNARLVGLDLQKGKYFIINLHAEGVLPRQVREVYTPRLLHLGEGKYCLLWRDHVVYKLRGMEESSADEGEEEEEEEENAVETTAKLDNPKEGANVESVKDRMPSGYGGYHCHEFFIDFDIAHKEGPLTMKRECYNGWISKATGCLTVISRRKLIALSHEHTLSHAFLMNVAVPKDSDNQITPDSGKEAATDRKRERVDVVLRPCKRRRDYHNRNVAVPKDSDNQVMPDSGIEVATDCKRKRADVVLRPCKKRRD